jgi:hypothetical protein
MNTEKIKITDRVKTFEDACKVIGWDPFDNVPDEYNRQDEIAYKKLKVIVEALNEDWEPDWKNKHENKYYPWFSMSGEFHLDGISYTYDNTSIGSRFCFRSEELALYAAKQFLDLYMELMTL